MINFTVLQCDLADLVQKICNTIVITMVNTCLIIILKNTTSSLHVATECFQERFSQYVEEFHFIYL